MNAIQNIIAASPMQVIGLLAALVAFAVQRRSSRSTVSGKFIEILASDIAALDSASRDTDAYTILQDRFIAQHNAFIHAVHVSGLFSKRGLKCAWKDYYGEEGEQEWWLLNEYSALMSNQLKNDNENTKELAIYRLKSIVNVCK